MQKRFLVTVILAGLMLTGATSAPPSPAAQAKQTKASVDNHPTALRGATIDVGCPPGRDVRSSDLCAQWKAADAASEGARWAWWQVILGAAGICLGTLTMAAAIAAAIYARRAAEEAGRSAKAAVDAHEAYMASERAIVRVRRAYIYPTHKGSESAAAYQIRLDVQNAGRASATITSYAWEVSVAPIFPATPRFQMYRTDLVEFGADLKTLRELSTDDPGEGIIWAMGYFDYNSVGRVHRTHFCFRGIYRPDDGYAPGEWELVASGCQELPEDT